MWILSIQYDAGHVAYVTNPEDVPADFGYRDVYLWLGRANDGSYTGGGACRVSRAKNFPRQWRNELGARNIVPSGWYGPVVCYEDGNFVDLA